MKAARDPDEFVADRFGHYLFGDHYLVWCADPTIGGMVFWGAPDEKDAAELIRVFGVELVPGRDPQYDIVTDGRRLDRVGRRPFDEFSRVAIKRLREQELLIGRHAVIAPDGLVGTIMAGFFPLLGFGDKHRVFREAEAAFRWLSAGASGGVSRTELMDEIDSIVTAHLGESPLVSALRRWLVDHLAEASVGNASRALGSSSRSLQRELSSLGTSFRGELDRARVELARQRLSESDDKVEVIAREVGCATLSSFSRLFRRVTGESPADYRARQRR